MRFPLQALQGQKTFKTFIAHLCGSSSAGLAGAKFLKIFNAYLCDSSLAGLAGANFATIFYVYLCASSLAGLAGTKLVTMFNLHLCGSFLAGLAGAKILEILTFRFLAYIAEGSWGRSSHICRWCGGHSPPRILERKMRHPAGHCALRIEIFERISEAISHFAARISELEKNMFDCRREYPSF